MTQYLLSIHHDYSQPLFDADTDVQALVEAVDAFNKEILAEGVWVFGGGLEAPESAITVTSNDGETVLTDGPFAQARERLGGFWVIEATDRDTATAWATKASAACGAPVEVRPFQAN